MIYREKNGLLFIRFDNHENFFEALKDTLKNTGIRSGVVINGIGMLRDFELGWFNIQAMRYEKHSFSVPHELLSLQGNIALKDNETFVHLHASLAGPSHECVGGHLFNATVCNTAELFIQKAETLSLKRVKGEQFSPLS